MFQNKAENLHGLIKVSSQALSVREHHNPHENSSQRESEAVFRFRRVAQRPEAIQSAGSGANKDGLLHR